MDNKNIKVIFDGGIKGSFNCPELYGLSIQSGDYLMLSSSRLLNIPALKQLVNPVLEITKIEYKNSESIVTVNAHTQDDKLDIDQHEKSILSTIYSYAPVHSASVEDYFLITAKENQQNPHVEPVRVEKMPQSNDVLIYQREAYQLDAICWDFRYDNKLNIYLISESQAKMPYDLPYNHSQTDEKVVVFSRHSHMRKRYKKFKDIVMGCYRSCFNFKNVAKTFVLTKLRIKTFLSNAKQRALRNAVIDLPFNAARAVGSLIPTAYAASIWGLGVDYASEYVIKFFDEKFSKERSPSALDKMIKESEFKYEEFSKRLNYSYWEVMELYQKIIAQSAYIPKLTDQEFTGENGFAQNVAAWDALRAETLEYAKFLKNIATTMESDLNCMDAQMRSVIEKFENRAIAIKAKQAHLRQPSTIVLAPGH